MGILKELRSKVQKGAEKDANIVVNTVAAAGALAPNQVHTVEEERKRYLSGMPKNGEEELELIRRQMGKIGVEVYNAYLPQIAELYLPIPEPEKFEGKNRISYFQITKWVKDPQEDNIEKLMNVYQVLNGEDCSIALIYHRSCGGCEVYLAVVNNAQSAEQADPHLVDVYMKRLEEAMKGNFPGVEIKLDGQKFYVDVPGCLQPQDQSVAIISNLAAEKTEKFAGQTMERLLDGIVPKEKQEEYTLVMLATPVRKLLERRDRLYELYSKLAPYSNWQTSYTVSETSGVGSSASVGFNLGITRGKSKGSGTAGQNDRVAVGKSHGFNAGASFARSSNISVSLAKNEGITQNFMNYGVKHTLELLEKQVQRLEESAVLGLWDFAAYVISPDSSVANNVAHTYLALSQGEESYLAESAVNQWRADLSDDTKKEKEQAGHILKSLSRLQHPEFGLNVLDMSNSSENKVSQGKKEFLYYPAAVNATIGLSGKELARVLSFPGRSISGLPVIETASFGRNISSYRKIDRDLSLGKIYHMHSEESSTVKLSKKSLASHVFITGSTGAGKTNTVIGILNQLALQADHNVHFMVVEPAKGEYKNVLSGYENVNVYGTNPRKTPLLKINPFSFPEDITVGEHIDRLVEIFNVCWPMYAAMPAILKDAVISAYEEAGWDIASSENRVQKDLYPSFSDVMKHVRCILKTSEYSSDTKGDYVGALVSRLKSMNNGINGQIFTSKALSDKDLFDKNVIVDMSRVGSTETKALIMGLLVLKLQEYRLSESKPDSEDLRHIMVLEEAHNLLRRTSLEQSSESANLLGKSVEMLTNSIAELRAFGEGFVIADQAPGLLDMAVIRNTNTKIVHRLPDQADRELVGRAMGLSDSQIAELAKLEQGVAAVYQNDWIETVLCKVNAFPREKWKEFKMSAHEMGGNPEEVSDREIRDRLADYLILTRPDDRDAGTRLQELRELVRGSRLSDAVKKGLEEYEMDVWNEDSRRKVLYDLLEMETAAAKADGISENEARAWRNRVAECIEPSLDKYPQQKEIVLNNLILELFLHNPAYESKLRCCSCSEEPERGEGII